MDRGLRERVRWGNVARALAVVAVVGLVVAWPRLAPSPPPVPRGLVRPLATVAPRVVVPPPARRPRKRPEVRRERRAGKEDGGSRPRRRKPRVVVAPSRPAPMATVAPTAAPGPALERAAPVAPPAPAPPADAPAPPDPDPVLREFGPEGG